MLVNGQWEATWNPYQKSNEKGEFIRQQSTFRHWISKDGHTGFKAEPNRYHLYVALICPWASRALLVRQLKGLQNIISISVVEPYLTDKGWRFASHTDPFPGADQDPNLSAHYLHEIYTHTDPNFTGRVTVPVLWDKQSKTIVNNESADIITMLNSEFDAWGNTQINLRPSDLLEEMKTLNTWLYDHLNNGVYKAGFAQSQQAYEQAVNQVFSALDKLESRLQDERNYLMGDHLTEADIRAFVTLIRFDVAYYNLFKCNLKRIADYPHLQRYMKNIYRIPGVNQTVNFDHIKHGYFSIKAINPTGIVPVGPKTL